VRQAPHQVREEVTRAIDAVGAWIERQTDRQESEGILGDLPRPPRGEGYL